MQPRLVACVKRLDTCWSSFRHTGETVGERIPYHWGGGREPWILYHVYSIYIILYIYIPVTCLSSILVLQPSKRRPFRIKTRVNWVPGIYTYIHIICKAILSVHIHVATLRAIFCAKMGNPFNGLVEQLQQMG